MTSASGMARPQRGRYAQVGMYGSACRMTVRANVRLPFGDVDETLRPIAPRRPVRRAQVNAPRHEQPAKGGLSLRAALGATAVFVFVLGIITLVNVSRMTERAKTLNALRLQVEAGQKANNELAVKLDAAADGAKIRYAAVRNLGMIAAEGAQVVYLTAPATRQETQQAQAAVPQARAGIYATLFGFLE